MVNSRELLKEEIFKNIKSIVILIIVVIALYKNYSITNLFKFDLNDRLVWAIDFTIYTAILNIGFSTISYLINKTKIHIESSIQNKEEGSNRVVLTNTSPKSVELIIIAKGRRKNIPNELKVVFPYWVDIQMKPRPYITEHNSNIILIDINYLIKEKEYVDLKEVISVDLIKNTDETNSENIEVSLKLNLVKKMLSIRHESKSIQIKIG